MQEPDNLGTLGRKMSPRNMHLLTAAMLGLGHANKYAAREVDTLSHQLALLKCNPPRYSWKPYDMSATGTITKVERKRRNEAKKRANASRKRNRV